MKVRVSSVIIFQLFVLLGVVLMLCDALDVLPVVDWPDAQATLWVQVMAALGILGMAAGLAIRGSRMQRKAENMRAKAVCAVNQP